jgi:hypothetical protein
MSASMPPPDRQPMDIEILKRKVTWPFLRKLSDANAAWRLCDAKPCKRANACCGDPNDCLNALSDVIGAPTVLAQMRQRARTGFGVAKAPRTRRGARMRASEPPM